MTLQATYYYVLVLLILLVVGICKNDVEISSETIVMQTKFGDIEAVFFPKVAPITYKHILKLYDLGAYNGGLFFRVDKDFVLQTQDVRYDRLVQLNSYQLEEANKTVPLEVDKNVQHVKGVLSMGRLEDPNSGGSSFSILVTDAPHLDMEYTIFGKVVGGLDTLDKMRQVETYQEGIFVIPKERVSILATYVKRNIPEQSATTIQKDVQGGNDFKLQYQDMQMMLYKIQQGLKTSLYLHIALLFMVALMILQRSTGRLTGALKKSSKQAV